MENTKTKCLYLNMYETARNCENLEEFNEFKDVAEEYVHDNPHTAGDKEFAVNLARRNAISGLMKIAKKTEDVSRLECLGNKAIQLASEIGRKPYHNFEYFKDHVDEFYSSSRPYEIISDFFEKLKENRSEKLKSIDSLERDMPPLGFDFNPEDEIDGEYDMARAMGRL